MAGVVFMLALFIEVAFAAYCIATRSSQRRARNFIRVGALLAFILFTLFAILQWSFRWYALATLLLIWAVVGAVQLLRARAETAAFKTGRSVWRAIGTLLLIFLMLVPAFVFPQHKSPRVTGPHPVATALYTYTDASRVESFAPATGKRQVNVEFWYPADGTGKYPLVVFSHGAFGVKTSNTSTFTELASHGYVVCSIDHPYHSLITRGADGRTVRVDPAFFQQILDANGGKYTDAESFPLWQAWLGLRTADINFVIDTIRTQASASDAGAPYAMIDAGKIGLMGHSLGGSSVGQVARQRQDIGAVVVLDADLQGEYTAYSDGKYTLNPEPYPAPILTIMADDMQRLIDQIPNAQDVVAVEHVTVTSPNAFIVRIRGTDHQSVTDLALISPFFVSLITAAVPKAGGGEGADQLYVIETLNDLVLKFFDAYLKGEGNFSPNPAY